MGGKREKAEGVSDHMVPQCSSDWPQRPPGHLTSQSDGQAGQTDSQPITGSSYSSTLTAQLRAELANQASSLPSLTSSPQRRKGARKHKHTLLLCFKLKQQAAPSLPLCLQPTLNSDEQSDSETHNSRTRSQPENDALLPSWKSKRGETRQNTLLLFPLKPPPTH